MDYCVNDATSPCARGPMHQLGAALVERDWRWHCERSYTRQFLGGLLEIFFIDTSPFITEFQRDSWAVYEGGILQQSWELQLKEVEARLAASVAPWKLMVGHHPPRSNGHHGNNYELVEHIEPLMQRYGVKAYFSGHDHNLEHLYVAEKDFHVFVSGGGSDCDRGFDTAVDSQYQFPSSGFAAVTVASNYLEVKFYNLETGDDGGTKGAAAAKPAYTSKRIRLS